jgi:hypothetical protein
MIKNATNNWSSKGWDLHTLATSKYAKAKFRIGDDENSRSIRIELDKYLQYLDLTNDDSPLYLFEDHFVELPSSSDLVHVYSPPKYFSTDLFLLISEERRPPFRWIIAGSARCGTKQHIDPLGTSAWNGLTSGIKRWVLFSPQTPMSIASGSFLYTNEEKIMGRAYEAVEYFDIIVPRIRKWMATLSQDERDRYGMREFLQHPGEVVFVPNSWPHAVVNHGCDAVSFTQNWASPYGPNFKEIWKVMCVRRRHLARRLFDRLTIFYPKLAEEVQNDMSNHPANIDHLFEPQNDPKMRPRRLSKLSIEQRLKQTPEAMAQIKSLFPNFFDPESGHSEDFKSKAIGVMLEGNEDSTDSSSSDDSDSDSDDDDDESSEGESSNYETE